MVIRRDDQGLVRFNLLDRDGTVLMSSKGFDSYEDADAGAHRAVELMGDVEVLDQTEGRNPVRSAPEVVEDGEQS